MTRTAIVTLFVGAVGCAPAAPAPQTVVPEAVDVEPTRYAPPPLVEGVEPASDVKDFVPDDCPLERATKQDVDGDGTPNLFTVESEGRIMCRAMDLSFDGKPDVTVFYDDAGRELQKLTDLDGDGVIDVRHRHGPDGCTAEHDVDGDGKVDERKPC